MWNEDETSPFIFIAYGEGFAPIKSLIEHAMTLDVTEHIDLYWAVADKHELYMHNHCRAWSDAFERFNYFPVIGDTAAQPLANDVLSAIQKDHATGAVPFLYCGTGRGNFRYAVGPAAARRQTGKYFQRCTRLITQRLL